MSVLMVIGGFALLLVGGEFLVRGAVGLAASFGVPALVIGLTVVAFGTSAPELVVSLQAALGGHPDIVLGNVVGSNIANILAIVGLAAAMRPISVAAGLVRRDGMMVFAVTVLFALACLLGEIGREMGVVMVLGLAGYSVWSFWAARRRATAAEATIEAEDAAKEELEKAPSVAWIAGAVTLAGIAAVVIGAELLIDGAVVIARAAGLSETVIGLTLIAFGTSLPELATSLMAAVRGHSDIALGNALGSNLFNMLGIVGVTAIVTPVAVPPEILRFDLWAMLGVTVALLVMMTTDRRVTRLEGGILFAAYLGYIGLLVSGVMGGAAVG